MKAKIKTIVATIVIFFVAMIVSLLFDNYYRELVRFLMTLASNNNIHFIGKDFHLFASDILTYSFGIFASLVFLLLKFSSRPYRIKRAYLTVLVFFVSTIFITALESKRFILNCTACDWYEVKLEINKIPYDRYFIMSLIPALTYLLIVFLWERRRFRKVV